MELVTEGISSIAAVSSPGNNPCNISRKQLKKRLLPYIGVLMEITPQVKGFAVSTHQTEGPPAPAGFLFTNQVK